jgi:ketosteroid isomerase-like protein
MSQENVDVVRRMFEGVNNRDAAAIQSACDPDFESKPRFTAVEGRTYRGPEGPADYLADLEEAWESLVLTIDELIPVGGETLVVVTGVEAVARGSGVPIQQRTYGVFEFREGKALRARFHPSREEALEAVGLSEDAHADSV